MLQFSSFQVRKPCKNVKCFYFNHKFFQGWENSLGIRFQPISTLHPPLAFMRKIANNCPGDWGLGASGRPAARSRVWGLVPGIPVFQARQGPTSTLQEVYLSTPSLWSSILPFCRGWRAVHCTRNESSPLRQPALWWNTVTKSKRGRKGFGLHFT